MGKRQDAIEDLLEYCDKKAHVANGKELAEILIGRPCVTVDDAWALAAAMKELVGQELMRCRNNLGINRPVTESIVDHQAALREELQYKDPELRSWSILWARYMCHLSAEEIAEQGNIVPRTVQLRLKEARENHVAPKLRELKRRSIVPIDEEQFSSQSFPKSLPTTIMPLAHEATVLSHSFSQESIQARYLDALRQQYGYVVLGGIALRVHDRMLRIPLDELFIDPSAEVGIDPTLQVRFVRNVSRGYQAVRTGNVASVGLNEIKSASRSVILGMPGSGKSTLLHWLIFEILRSQASPDAGHSQQPLPLFIRLTHLAQALQQYPALSLEHYLRQWYFTDHRSLIQTALLYGHIWLLLDGLDEVADRHIRWQVSNAIETFAAQFPNVERIIITSRVVGYRTAQLSDAFRHFTLQPFGPLEIKWFVHKWYRAIYRLTQLSPDYAEAERRASRLLEGLNDKPRVQQLAGTPLFLALIALMDWKGKEIPRRRVELYEAATKTLLEDWPTLHGRPVQDELTMDEMLHILAQLALEIFKTSHEAAIRQDIIEARIADLIRAARRCSPSEAASLARRWLTLLSEQSGLLLDAGIDTFNRPVYTFLHLSFVEYLCGRAMANQWRNGNLDLLDYASDPRWHEILLLMAGYIGMDYSVDEATRLVEAIWTLTLPHQDVLHQPLVLAATCLADDVIVSDDLREHILEELLRCWYDATPSRLKSRLFRLLGAMRGTDSAPAVIRRVLPLLDQGRDHARSSVIELLGSLGAPADDTLKICLLNALHHPAVDVQRAGVRALGLVGFTTDSDVRFELLEALAHPDAGVRTRAVLALGPFTTNDQDITRAFLHVLAQDQHDEPRLAAARMLAATNKPGDEALTALCAAILGGSKGMRKEAIAGYVTWDTSSRDRVLARLREALHDPDQASRQKAAEVTVEISLVLRDDAEDLVLEAIQNDANHDLSIRVPLINALGTLTTPGDQVLDLLTRLLKDGHPKVRIEAAAALNRLAIRNQSVALELVKSLHDGNPALRRTVAAALGTCGIRDQVTVSALEGVLSDADEFVCISAIQSLLRLDMHKVKAQARLVALLRSTNAEVRRLAAQTAQGVMRTLPASGIAILVDRISDTYRNVSENALRALAELGREANADVMTACREALRHTYHGVRVAAAEALGRIGQADDATVSALLAAITDPVDHVRLAASNALTALGQGPERETIIRGVRALLDQYPGAEGVHNTLWELVVGE